MIDAVASGAVALGPSLEAVHAPRVDASQEPLDAREAVIDYDGFRTAFPSFSNVSWVVRLLQHLSRSEVHKERARMDLQQDARGEWWIRACHGHNAATAIKLGIDPLGSTTAVYPGGPNWPANGIMHHFTESPNLPGIRLGGLRDA